MPPKVLIVDDDADVRASLVALVGRALPGARIAQAASGEAALPMLDADADASAPLLILSDYNMGRACMTGLAFLAAARERRPDARRILISGEDTATLRASGLDAAGLDDAFPKPVPMAAFLARLRALAASGAGA